MSRRKALTPDQEVALLAWFNDYSRVGTLTDKARELNIDVRTLRNTVARANGTETTYGRQKIAPRETVDIEQLAEQLTRRAS